MRCFGRFVFLRDDFGLQFRLGNGPSADGMLMPYLQPNLNKLELEKFQQMGELAYADAANEWRLTGSAQHPARFAVISLKRFFYYWNGVPRPTGSRCPVDFRNSAFLATSVLAIWGLGRALRQKRPGAWLFAGLVLTYPAVYYFVFPHARYRHPIEPELLILIVFLLSEVRGRSTRSVTSVPSGPRYRHGERYLQCLVRRKHLGSAPWRVRQFRVRNESRTGIAAFHL